MSDDRRKPESQPSLPAGAAPVLESEALFGRHQEVVIRHNGRDYRLRRTRFDKLILTA